MLQPGDRIRLARSGKAGKVLSVVDAENTYVKLDNGIACTFPTAALIPEAAAAAGETKTWPPEGIETK